jgi:hypothetical protein
MTDLLLFLHLLSAAAVVAGIVGITAAVRGVELGSAAAKTFVFLTQAGLIGALVFGVVLAIDIDGYEVWDVWVLIAIGLWVAAGGFGDVVAAHFRKTEPGAPVPADVARAHWVETILVLLLLADMIWKPWS